MPFNLVKLISRLILLFYMKVTVKYMTFWIASECLQKRMVRKVASAKPVYSLWREKLTSLTATSLLMSVRNLLPRSEDHACKIQQVVYSRCSGRLENNCNCSKHSSAMYWISWDCWDSNKIPLFSMHLLLLMDQPYKQICKFTPPSTDTSSWISRRQILHQYQALAILIVSHNRSAVDCSDKAIVNMLTAFQL